MSGRFTGAAVVGTFAAIFAVALSGISGWLIIRASEQPPILYLLTAIVGVRFFGIGRAVLRYWERLLLHDAVFGALTRLRGRLWESLSRKALSLRRLLQGGNVLGTVIDDVDTVRDLLPRVVLPPVTALAVAGSALAATALVAPAALPAVALAAALSLLVAPAAALWGTAALPQPNSACGQASCGAPPLRWMPGRSCTRTASPQQSWTRCAPRTAWPPGHRSVPPGPKASARPSPSPPAAQPPWPPPC
ncbi:ATP-binding/permease protein CydD [Arthrobacter sp. Hiyo4]|nr:ATP-binding/permease protein CydD [Arthrobacter sp. Hiyo4]